MRVAYFAPFWAMQAAFPHMKASGWGRIVNLCSLNGVNAHVGTTEYNCAKEALRTLTRTAAREWAPYGIVANARFNQRDGLHPTVAGYQVWADALRPLLTELLGPPAGEDHAPPPTGDPSAQK